MKLPVRPEGKLIYNKSDIASFIRRISDAILREFSTKDELSNMAFLGIQIKGAPLAGRIIREIEKKTKFSIPLGTIDISMYRDDIGARPKILDIHETSIPFNIENRIIILVDDVLQTGRTIRAALDAITDYGRPKLIRLAVLIDRKMREFPIQSDFAGLRKEFPSDQKISIKCTELNDEDAVYVYNRGKNRHHEME